MERDYSSTSTTDLSDTIELAILDAEEMAAEYGGDLGDARRTKRARRLGAQLSQNASVSLPNLLNSGDLEAAYRLLNNDDVHWRDLLAPHVNQTLKRAADAQGGVFVIHDTTDLMFKRHNSDSVRENMVCPSSRTQGMRLHLSIVVAMVGLAVPFGTLALQPFVHRCEAAVAGPETVEFWDKEGGLYENERQRWFDGVIDTHEMLKARGVHGVHLADSEADSYGLLAGFVKRAVPIIVRSACTRHFHDQQLRDFGTIDVALGARGDLRNAKSLKSHPAREARIATLTLSAGQVTLRRAAKAADTSWSPDGWEGQPPTLTLNIVIAEERNPPKGVTPVQWLLLTNEPVDTDEAALAVLDGYRRRWLIEELNKALKTGCLLEKRQMDSASSMLNMTAMLLPAAWRLLYIRTIAEQAPDAPWEVVLTQTEFEILRTMTNKRSKSPRRQLGERATVYDCMIAIARLGGHIASKGRPGWQTLHRGWTKLADWVEGASIAREIFAQNNN